MTRGTEDAGSGTETRAWARYLSLCWNVFTDARFALDPTIHRFDIRQCYRKNTHKQEVWALFAPHTPSFTPPLNFPMVHKHRPAYQLYKE